MNAEEYREAITLYAARLSGDNSNKTLTENIEVLEHFDALVCEALKIDQEEQPPHFLFTSQ